MFSAPQNRSAPPAARTRILWSLGALGLILLAFGLDNPVDAALNMAGHPAWGHFVWWCSKIGEWWLIGLAGFLLAALLIWGRRLELARAILFVTLASGLTGLAATVLRTLLGRPRPNNTAEPQGFYGVWHQGHCILGRPEFSSFPSGHAATVAGLAMAVWLLDRRVGALAWVYALVVMWSRIAQNAHHFSDVVAATVVGMVGAKLIYRWLPPLLTVWTERFRH